MKSYLFVSYASFAREDRDIARATVQELERLGLSCWIAERDLQPGENWSGAIAKALSGASAVLAFISPYSETSQYIKDEIEAARRGGTRIIAISLGLGSTEAQALKGDEKVDWLDLQGVADNLIPPRAAEWIVEVVKALPKRGGTEAYVSVSHQALADNLAAQSRKSVDPDAEGDVSGRPDSLFIVHGHDDAFLEDVKAFVQSLGIKPIVMRDVGGAATSLIQKFFEIGGAARYAVVLMSGDDFGAPRNQYEAKTRVSDPESDIVGVRALQYRARQNVILEMGFFYGLLGWENVFVLERPPPEIYPNFERPSDLNGVLFDRYDDTGRWHRELYRRLEAHGFQMPPLLPSAGKAQTFSSGTDMSASLSS